jgi:hypothetical protein
VAFPAPVPGLVIRYSYLWHHERARGQEEGIKDRPCAIVLVTEGEAAACLVTVLPVTYAPPASLALAVELPQVTKRRLGLEDARSWVVLTEANRFVWPGPDLRPTIPGDAASIAHGVLPHALFEEIRQKFIAVLRPHAAHAVRRTE